MSFCTKCGAELNDEMLFCPKCGCKNIALSDKAESESAYNNAPSKKKNKGLFALLALLVAAAAAAFILMFPDKEVPFSENPEAISAAASSVVRLDCYDKNGELYATGSGFAMFEEGTIVTNYHVIADGVYSITAQREDGMSFEINHVVAYDAQKDIAILKTNAVTGMTLLAQGDPTLMSKGENVVAIGSPLGILNSVSEGVFSGYLSDAGESYIQFTAAISHGSSGGPLFDDHGNVIGITSASYEDGQNLNLAVPIEEVTVLWEKRSAPVILQEFVSPTISSYSVNEVFDNVDELVGQEIVVEGYISFTEGFYMHYSGKNILDFGIVSNEKDILNYIYTGNDWSGMQHICDKQMYDKIAIRVFPDFDDKDKFLAEFTPKKQVAVKGYLVYRESLDNTWYDLDASEIMRLEN